MGPLSLKAVRVLGDTSNAGIFILKLEAHRNLSMILQGILILKMLSSTGESGIIEINLIVFILSAFYRQEFNSYAKNTFEKIS